MGEIIWKEASMSASSKQTDPVLLVEQIRKPTPGKTLGMEDLNARMCVSIELSTLFGRTIAKNS